MKGFDLKILRLRADMTQWLAAQTIGIPPQDLCHAERGRRKLPEEVETRLLRLYQSRIDEISDHNPNRDNSYTASLQGNRE